MVTKLGPTASQDRTVTFTQIQATLVGEFARQAADQRDDCGQLDRSDQRQRNQRRAKAKSEATRLQEAKWIKKVPAYLNWVCLADHYQVKGTTTVNPETGSGLHASRTRGRATPVPGYPSLMSAGRVKIQPASPTGMRTNEEHGPTTSSTGCPGTGQSLKGIVDPDLPSCAQWSLTGTQERDLCS